MLESLKEKQQTNYSVWNGYLVCIQLALPFETLGVLILINASYCNTITQVILYTCVCIHLYKNQSLKMYTNMHQDFFSCENIHILACNFINSNRNCMQFSRRKSLIVLNLQAFTKSHPTLISSKNTWLCAVVCGEKNK